MSRTVGLWVDGYIIRSSMTPEGEGRLQVKRVDTPSGLYYPVILKGPRWESATDRHLSHIYLWGRESRDRNR